MLVLADRLQQFLLHLESYLVYDKVHEVIHLVRLSEGKELPCFQRFKSTKTSNKFVNSWGKIISAETLLDENMSVACMERLHL